MRMVVTTFTGGHYTGTTIPISLPGVKAGDPILYIRGSNGNGENLGTSVFEGTAIAISVNDQIQQTGGGDLSSSTFKICVIGP